tara:strand:- start:253 stop:513 length:261 start_codon:yes stop_codon:yes gene_type:complete
MKRIKKHYRPTIFNVGDFLYCHDHDMNKALYGIIIKIIKNKNGTKTLTIRWSDLFVAIEECTETTALARIKARLWNYKPVYGSTNV